MPDTSTIQVSQPALTVLIIEDNLADARRASLMLEETDMDCVVSFAHSLAEAKPKLEERPRVVLLDLGLPGVERTEALEFVVGICPEAFVVVVTGSDDEEIAVEAAEFGPSDYLRKNELSAIKLKRIIRSAICREERTRSTNNMLVMLDKADSIIDELRLELNRKRRAQC